MVAASYRYASGRTVRVGLGQDGQMSDVSLASDTRADAGRRALSEFLDREPERHPLILGFVGALGTQWPPVMSAFQESLRRFGYNTNVVHLSQLIDKIPSPTWSSLPTDYSLTYYKQRMDAGDALRTAAQNGSALAALAVWDIYEHRHLSEQIPQAYLLRSLKHPDEVKLLRHIYGDAFWLISIASNAAECRDNLVDRFSNPSSYDVPDIDADTLIRRDQVDIGNREYGQNVRGTYSIADVFVPVGRGEDIRPDIDRFLDALFGAPFITPTASEEGMMFAQTAALRSAAAGRQVGAALIPEAGTPIVAGVNEVPKPGGGQYWTGDSPDHRDFQTGQDPNPIYTRRTIQEVLERLARHGWLTDNLREMNGEKLVEHAYQTDATGRSLLSGTRASSLIEFTRCLHAEQAAIINAARSGISTRGAALYSTTFPCHECAKLIVGAGIKLVYYIEPYPKSMVESLYRDLIDTSPPLKRVTSPGSGTRIPFLQFIGIAPTRYAQLFLAGERKIGYQLIEFDRQHACPRTSGWIEDGIAQREEFTNVAITRIIDEMINSSGDEYEPHLEEGGTNKNRTDD